MKCALNIPKSGIHKKHAKIENTFSVRTTYTWSNKINKGKTQKNVGNQIVWGVTINVRFLTLINMSKFIRWCEPYTIVFVLRTLARTACLSPRLRIHKFAPTKDVIDTQTAPPLNFCYCVLPTVHRMLQTSGDLLRRSAPKLISFSSPLVHNAFIFKKCDMGLVYKPTRFRPTIWLWGGY